jgi:predicted XRE-type DNA-binding protein
MQQWGLSLEDQKEKEAITSAYIQQAYAAKLIGIMVASSTEIAEKMVQFQCCSALLNVVANVHKNVTADWTSRVAKVCRFNFACKFE